MDNFKVFLNKASNFHGHVCAGIILGTKMTLAALNRLDIDPQIKNKNLIVYVETDRCMTDAVQAITGCSLGHRSLKHIDYGKFAATYVNLETHKAVRVTIKESFDSHGPAEEVLQRVLSTPDADFVILQDVKINIPETDLPGNPTHRAYCAICGERVIDGRDVKRGEQVLCRGCANGKYYVE